MQNLCLLNNTIDIKNDNNSKNTIYIKNEVNIITTNNIQKNNITFINDYEINNLKYEDALLYDKRNYFQYYFSLLKMKHILIFTFYTKNDYNSREIKIILFLFTFSLNYTINTLFFNESEIHQIYEEQGKYNFVHQLPRIIYSLIISSVINVIIKNISLTEGNIVKIKKIKEIENIEEQKLKFLNLLFIKFKLFFIILYIFILFFWYYLSCFCAVYQNTQKFLIKDALIGFGLSFIYPFILNLLPGIFRIPSLNKNNRNYLYIISKIIQFI